jgi:hypothetical protein
MKRHRRNGLIGITIFSVITLLFFYVGLENFYYHDFGCGCSSACTGYYVSKTSKVIGQCLLLCSATLFIFSVWKIKGLSIWWTLPALTIFTISFYGNGYMLYNKGACGFSINRTTFFIFQDKLGDFAKIDGEYFSIDSLKNKKYDGKLLGYYLDGDNLTVYRIAEEPLKLKTGFLFWQLDKNVMIGDLSYGLSAYRKPPTNYPEKRIELIGGQGMPLEAFLQELKITNNWGITKIIDRHLIESSDGTTRLILSIE